VVLSATVIVLSLIPATGQAGIFPPVGKKVFTPLVIGQRSDAGLWGYVTGVPAYGGWDLKITLLQTGTTWYTILQPPAGSTTAYWKQCCLPAGYTYRVEIYNRWYCQKWEGYYSGGLLHVPNLNCGSM
jgi:hypothetical protein